MAKVTLKPMAGPDHPIYQQGVHIGAPIRASRWKAEIPIPTIIYDTDRDRGDLEFICTVEWTWSHSHERVSSYYLGTTETEHELWSSFYDEMTGEDAWCCCVSTEKTELDSQIVASTLLAFLWRHEAEDSSVGHFDAVSAEGLLIEDQVVTIADLVWRQ